MTRLFLVKSVHNLNNKPTFDEKQLRVLDIVTRYPDLSQRELARRVGISLGLTNLILKRLIQTGYLKVANFDTRKATYMLTTKGFQEKSIRSYDYLVRTIRTFKTLQERMNGLISKLVADGHKQFVLQGNSEISDLALLSLRDFPNVSFRHLNKGEIHQRNEMLLDCQIDGDPGPYGISVLEELLEHHHQTSIGRTHYELV